MFSHVYVRPIYRGPPQIHSMYTPSAKMAHLVVSVEAFVGRREAACGPFRKPVPSRWDVGGMGVADCVCVVGSHVNHKLDLLMIYIYDIIHVFVHHIY